MGLFAFPAHSGFAEPVPDEGGRVKVVVSKRALAWLLLMERQHPLWQNVLAATDILLSANGWKGSSGAFLSVEGSGSGQDVKLGGVFPI